MDARQLGGRFPAISPDIDSLAARSFARIREIFANNFNADAMLSESQFLGVMKEAQTQGANSFSGTLERAR